MDTTSPRTVSRSNRLHLALMGNRNSGKSSLINALTGQTISIVSSTPGTTTDLVYKSFEWPGVGPVVLIDTAGLDEDPADTLGQKRVQSSTHALRQSDFALLLWPASQPWEGQAREQFLSLLSQVRKQNKPHLILLTQIDSITRSERARAQSILAEYCALSPETLCPVSAETREGLEELRQRCTKVLQPLVAQNQKQRITAGLVETGDLVLLVMPQDKSAPQGRLIQAQSQTIRELLDIGAITLSIAPAQLEQVRQIPGLQPKLVICDSQVFAETQKMIGDWPLTSFSILFAAYKSDLNLCLDSVQTLSKLQPQSRILIAEACSHQPLNEDIGRVKIPNLLRQRFGNSLTIDFVNGSDLPDDETLRSYDLIIQCGGCMFTRTHMLERTSLFAGLNIPLCNYGIVLAWLNGLLDQVVLPR